MRESGYWADNYQQNRLSVAQAIAKIQSGQRVFIGSSCGEPQHLVKGLADASLTFTDLEIVRLFSAESTSLSQIADRSRSQNLNIRSFYLGSANSKSFKGDLRFITPINLSDIHRLIKSRLLPIQVALIQVTPPDDFGWMSLGISVDITSSAAAAADLVIAQVNPKMPRVQGRSNIHVNDIDYFVEMRRNCGRSAYSPRSLPQEPLPDMFPVWWMTARPCRCLSGPLLMQTSRL